jgi:hypothetical protein
VFQTSYTVASLGLYLCVAPLAASGIQICINATNTTNPLRNFSILPVELLSQNVTQNPFHPDFLAAMAGVTVVRFDLWLKTDNGNAAVRSWDSRVRPEDMQVGPTGVAVEYMIALCNAVHAVPWLLLPQASGPTDPYLNGFANMILANLDPSLDVIIEYDHGLGYNSVRASLRFLSPVSLPSACQCSLFALLMPTSVRECLAMVPLLPRALSSRTCHCRDWCVHAVLVLVAAACDV